MNENETESSSNINARSHAGNDVMQQQQKVRFLSLFFSRPFPNMDTAIVTNFFPVAVPDTIFPGDR